MKVLWAPEAEDALLAIILRLNGLSEGSGDRLAERLRRQVTLLEDFPHLGRVVPEFRVALIREMQISPYRVFYKVFPDRVEIVSIRHGRERLETD